MNEEIKVYYYKLKGDSETFSEIRRRAESMKGVYSVELDNDVLKVNLGNWASEYDVFRTLSEYAEGIGADVDYASDVSDGENTGEEVSDKEVFSGEHVDEKNEKPTYNAEEPKIPDEEKSWPKRFLPNFIEIGVAAILLLIAAFANVSENAKTFMCLIAFAFVVYEIIWDAITAVSRKDFFNYNIALALAVIVALFLSGAKYTEVTFVAILFETEITLYKILLFVRNEGIKRRLYHVFDAVNVIGEDGEEQSVAKNVPVGSEVAFSKGEAIVFDGVVKSGECVVDLYDISGIRKSKKLVAGDKTIGGAIVKEGKISVITEKTAENSFSTEIYNKLVRGKGGTVYGKVKKFSDIALPVSFGLALIVAFLLPLVLSVGGKTYSSLLPDYAYLAVILFAICNSFAIIAPHAVLRESAVYRALSYNIFFDNDDDFYAVADIGVVFFIEPGALTNAETGYDKIVSKPAYKGKIVKLISEYGLSLTEISENERISGKKENSVLVSGAPDVLREEGFSVKEAGIQGNVRYLFLDGEAVGAIAFEEKIKKNARGAVKELKDAGVKSIALTGESPESVSGFGKTLEVFGGLSEEDERKVTEEYSAAGKKFICVGNGAPEDNSLADIIYAGTDEFVSGVKAVCIPDGDVKSVAKYVKLAKRNRKIFKTGIISAIALKSLAAVTVAVLFALFSFRLLWAAVLIDFVAGVLVTLNAFRNGSDVY